MVKVIELSQEEINDRERKSKLVQISKDKVGRFRVSNNGVCISINSFIFSPFNSIYIHPNSNNINVSNPKYLDTAIELAKAYEEAEEGEFTVKKEYEERRWGGEGW
tara:strand:+ start:3166 stop:3483 length:318 start_codon:yes stop_codon:yes gene_type:complete